MDYFIISTGASDQCNHSPGLRQEWQSHWYFHSGGSPVIVLIFQQDECGRRGRAECCDLETETWQSLVGKMPRLFLPAAFFVFNFLWINELKVRGKKKGKDVKRIFIRSTCEGVKRVKILQLTWRAEEGWHSGRRQRDKWVSSHTMTREDWGQLHLSVHFLYFWAQSCVVKLVF